MGYSIYCDLKPEAIEAVEKEPKRFEILANFFKDDYRRKLLDGLAFAWTKPRGNRDHEEKFLIELKGMHDLGLLVEMSADNDSGEKPLKDKVPNACLIPYIREQG
jgi:hypothetical protein